MIPMRRSLSIKLSTGFTLLLPLIVGAIGFLEEQGWLPMVIVLVVLVPLFIVTWLHSPQTLMIDRNVPSGKRLPMHWAMPQPEALLGR